MRVIGLMSGTSADGVDAALLEIEGAPPTLQWKLLCHRTYPHSPVLRAEIFACMRPENAGVDRLCALNFMLGEAFASAALRLAADAALPMDSVNLIGSHGQTLWHIPVGETPSTLQLGEAAVIAERTGVQVVNNFRTRDMAAGGQGAPLVAFADALILTLPSRVRICQNIGGIANLTWLPPGEPGGAFAFDTGPGNMLLDAAAQRISCGRLRCDLDGTLAGSGSVDEDLLEDWLESEPYFRQAPPKTTGREMFGAAYEEHLQEEAARRGLDKNDYMATLTALTARSIADACCRFLPRFPQEIILSGGGALNPVLVRMLQGALSPAQLRLSDDLGLPSSAKEAAIFAILAYESWHLRPANLPAATGARHPVVLGSFTPGAARPSKENEPAAGTEAAMQDMPPLESMSALDFVQAMNRTDEGAALALRTALPQIASAIDTVAARMQNGGRLIYMGAGTSGRLGVLDASECPPTFGVEPERVVGLIAGGEKALRFSVENAEDDREGAVRDLDALHLTAADSVVGISASGGAPYVLSGLEYARSRGAFTAALYCNHNAPAAALAEVSICIPTGPELLAGSTRLKAGTATKMALNMLSTGVMVRLGHVRGNRMVDMRPVNDKLRRRAVRMVMEEGRLSEQEALHRLEAAGWDIRRALDFQRS